MAPARRNLCGSAERELTFIQRPIAFRTIHRPASLASNRRCLDRASRVLGFGAEPSSTRSAGDSVSANLYVSLSGVAAGCAGYSTSSCVAQIATFIRRICVMRAKSSVATTSFSVWTSLLALSVPSMVSTAGIPASMKGT